MTVSQTRGCKGRRYSDQFKREAVDFLISTQATLAQVSEELGVSIPTLSRWRDELADADQTTKQDRQSELEAENHRLRRENEFLKKASSYFASRHPTGIRS